MVLQNGKTGQNVKAPITFLLPTLMLSPAIDEEDAKIVAKDPPKMRRHGREYSLQLKATDRPINVKEDNVTVEEQTAAVPVPPIEVGPKRLSRPQPPPHDPAFLSPLDAKRIARQQHMQSFPPRHHNPNKSSTREYSVEEEFARRFGYQLPSFNNNSNIAPVQEITFFTTFEELNHPPPPVRKPRPRSSRIPSLAVDQNEEGFLVLLPPPSLLRPSSFWRNTSRSALHTPSFHLVRRSTFIAAGLSLEEPTCDLSISAVEGRITIGKTKGLSGGAGISNSWDLFG